MCNLVLRSPEISCLLRLLPTSHCFLLSNLISPFLPFLLHLCSFLSRHFLLRFFIFFHPFYLPFFLPLRFLVRIYFFFPLQILCFAVPSLSFHPFFLFSALLLSLSFSFFSLIFLILFLPFYISFFLSYFALFHPSTHLPTFSFSAVYCNTEFCKLIEITSKGKYYKVVLPFIGKLMAPLYQDKSKVL